MLPRALAARSLLFYWRTNLAVVAGVATAVTVLGGALLVGDSVRGSLRDLVLQRLGRTDLVVAGADFFREQLAVDIGADAEAGFTAVAPIVAVPGVATDQASGRRAARVQVYGVDERFWRFHGVDAPADGGSGAAAREVDLSETLAREIGAAPRSTVLLRVQRPSDIPLESLHGRKDDVGRTIRLTVRRVLAAPQLGEFSLQPQQGDVRAAFVPLGRLQQELGVEGRVNTILVSEGDPERVAPPTAPRLEEAVRRHAALEDVGLKLRLLRPAVTERPAEAEKYPSVVSVESPGTLIDEAREQAIVAAARDLTLTPTPVLTYLVNAIRTASREIPYSLVTAIELTTLRPDLRSNDADLPPILLNEWAARDLAAGPGDRVTLDYYVWEEPGRLVTRSSSFRVAAVVPLSGPFADRDFAPEYPGITDTDNLRDWDPPFPIDLRRIRDVDEEYWERYRTTPKAFVPEPFGRAFWASRYGSLTSIRLAARDGSSAAADRFAATLRAAIDPVAFGLAVRDVRTESLAASRGATDFGEYFTYFSFFLVVSALTLTALFFKLGIEQRAREVGLLRAVGFTTPAVRRLFTIEGLVLATAGGAIGIAGAIGYAQLLMIGLTTWWVDAVGTTALRLHVTPLSLAAGALGGVAAAVVCIWWTLRGLSRISERSLLAGQVAADAPLPGEATSRLLHSKLSIVSFVSVSLLLLLLSSMEALPAAAGFFGAGALLLVASLLAAGAWLRRPPKTMLGGHGWPSMARLGMRNASYRPARSVMAIAVMAAATFILVSVGAFRRGGDIDWSDRQSGTGGYGLLVETVMPFVHDPNSDEGRELTGLESLDDAAVEPFRLLPGDDASCLNLYEPRQPRIVGVRREFAIGDRFTFAGTLDGAERDNPWLLLFREQDDGAIPVIADANSMTYVLHKALGDEIVFSRGGRDIRLRLVASLSDSVFQSELLMSDEHFRRLFPDQEGYGLLMVSAPAARLDEAAAAIEDRLGDLGADAVRTADRLAEFHRVENTYLSTFQTLGGLGLLLGTIGLAAVLLRNVLERRRELALLGAVGYGRSRLFAIVVAESALLLVGGVAAGAICAIIATAPAASGHGVRVPISAGVGLLLFGVLATGLVSSVVAARAAIQSRLLDALRAE